MLKAGLRAARRRQTLLALDDGSGEIFGAVRHQIHFLSSFDSGCAKGLQSGVVISFDKIMQALLTEHEPLPLVRRGLIIAFLLFMLIVAIDLHMQGRHYYVSEEGWVTSEQRDALNR